jgi:hypothetical protein
MQTFASIPAGYAIFVFKLVLIAGFRISHTRLSGGISGCSSLKFLAIKHGEACWALGISI